jgi:membrane fusion protein (multidrug efflux system)
VAAVQTDQSSQFVLLVGTDNKVTQQTVTLGEQVGQNFIVDSGLSQGDRVIVDGIQKVKVGQQVDPSLEPNQQASASSNSATSD